MAPDTLDPTTRTTAHATLEVRGPASASFLQGQLSQDLERVDDAPWSLLLTPDSVVITTCYVSRHEEGFDVVVPAALGEAARARLARFLLRVACTVELRAGGTTPLASDEARIAAGWPGVAEFAASLTPHSFGRRFVAATVSFDKGCFTGQELVGRLDARGSSVPWRLVRVSGPSRARVDEVLRAKGPTGPQGVTSATERDGALEGLAIAHRTLLGSAAELVVGDVVVRAID